MEGYCEQSIVEIFTVSSSIEFELIKLKTENNIVPTSSLLTLVMRSVTFLVCN